MDYFKLYQRMERLYEAVKAGKKIVFYGNALPSNDSAITAMSAPKEADLIGKSADGIVFSEYNDETKMKLKRGEMWTKMK